MPRDFTDDKSTLVQVMAWCRQASHCLSQCCPKSISPYGVTMPQWLNNTVYLDRPGGCFTNVSRAPQNILAKIHNTKNHIYGENFNLKICTCAQSKALGTRTKFQLEILITSTICAIHKFRENFLESSRNVSETTPRNANNKNNEKSYNNSENITKNNR